MFIFPTQGFAAKHGLQLHNKRHPNGECTVRYVETLTLMESHKSIVYLTDHTNAVSAVEHSSKRTI